MRTEVRVRLRQTESLKAKLGIGAALLGGVTLVLAAILYLGMTRVADRLEAALATETRLARYSTLSREASTFIVIATETVQTERPPEVRAERLEPVSEAMARTFTLLRPIWKRRWRRRVCWASMRNRGRRRNRWGWRGWRRC